MTRFGRKEMSTSFGVSIGLLLVCAAGDALAQDNYGILPPRNRSYESPQRFAIEVRLGPYRPDVDSAPGLTGRPYEAVFGTDGALLLAAEFDWQAFRIPYVGTIGPGVSAGLWSKSARAFYTGTNDLSGDDTTLSVYPVHALGVLRADVFARELRVPLVPYLKMGAGLAFWRASTTLGTANVDNTIGSGRTFGTHLAGGVAFLLDVLDSQAATNLDQTMGINNTYLFLEYMQSRFGGLGQERVMYLGDSTWTAGLAFEF